MHARLAAIGENDTLGDDILDQLEGEALVILEHPDLYMAVTVAMARSSLELIQRLRRRNSIPAARVA
ncbi:hypothetical protein [Magnetospirillum sp. 15-1]|uniref:hypothetical protein n=1 Tax=Magnetospirillum sp. 15-1 TaxID=1979370 RepID=UPI000BBC9218|nr:hypothetical protein [Magnetospirillum sp. 15-1]